MMMPSSVTSIQVRLGPIHLGVSASFGTPTIPSENPNYHIHPKRRITLLERSSVQLLTPPRKKISWTIHTLSIATVMNWSLIIDHPTAAEWSTVVTHHWCETEHELLLQQIIIMHLKQYCWEHSFLESGLIGKVDAKQRCVPDLKESGLEKLERLMLTDPSEDGLAAAVLYNHLDHAGEKKIASERDFNQHIRMANAIL